MMWIVMGSTFLFNVIGATNAATIDLVFQKPFVLLLEACVLTSDVLFFLGGFFLAYKFAKDSSNTYKKYVFTILQKLMRILPAYVLTILFWYSVFIHLGSGPRWIPL